MIQKFQKAPVVTLSKLLVLENYFQINISLHKPD